VCRSSRAAGARAERLGDGCDDRHRSAFLDGFADKGGRERETLALLDSLAATFAEAQPASRK
jgi:hypothetical protein